MREHIGDKMKSKGTKIKNLIFTLDNL